MGWRYQNKLDEEAERRWLASLPLWKRVLYKASFYIFMSIGGIVAFYSIIGWWLIKLF